MNWYAIIGLITFLIAIGINVYYDFRKWEKNLNADSNLRNHNKGWRLKAITCAVPAILLFIGSDFKPVIAAIAVTLGLFIVFNVLFDGFLSLCKGRWFFYLGSRDATHDPHTDRFWMGMPTWMHITLKISFSLLSIYVYCKGLK